MPETRARSTHSTGDLIYDATYIAGLGGGIVALFFLAYDALVHGDVFFTPSLMGSVLFEGASAETVQHVSMSAMTKYTAVHMLAFSVFGLVLSWLTHQVEIRSQHPVRVMALVFVGLELAFWAGASFLMPGVLARIGVIPVAIANLLSAVGISLFLVSSHRGDLWFQIKRVTGLAHSPRT